jgi:hypothetical protein
MVVMAARITTRAPLATVNVGVAEVAVVSGAMVAEASDGGIPVAEVAEVREGMVETRQPAVVGAAGQPSTAVKD